MTHTRKMLLAAGAAIAAALLAASPAANPAAQGAGAASGAPLRENLPRSWYRNFDYGIEVNGSLSPEVGLFQVVGERLMLIYGPSLDRGYVLSFEPKVVRAVPKTQVTAKNDLEVVVPPAAFDSGEPIPWMQDGPAAIFYADSKRYKVARMPPIIGATNIDEIFKHNPMYRRGMEEYVPNPGSVAALKMVHQRAVIEVWFGSWCPHCQRIVPRFLKAIQAVANPNLDVVLHGVPREFATYDPAVKKQVDGLPTFIFLRDGKEFARMGGAAELASVEDEMARILGVATRAGGK